MNERLVGLSTKFSDAKARYEVKEAELKKISAEWLEIEGELLEAMIDEGVNSISIEGVGMFSLRTKNYLSVNAANKEKFYKYLQESGNGDLLKLDVNPKTLTAFLSDHLENKIKSFMLEHDLDTVEARIEALKFLNEQGASYFTKRDISMRKNQ